MNYSVFDLHCDTAMKILETDIPGRLSENEGHVDFRRGLELPGYAQFFAFCTYPGMPEAAGRPIPQVLKTAVEYFLQQLSENQGRAAQARSAAEVERVAAAGKAATLLSLEGPAGIDFDEGRLEDLYQLGFRMTTLTWNEENPLAGSHMTGGGLTERGKAYVRRAQALGMLMDVSHLSEQAFWGLLDVTQGPIVASHSNSRSVCSVSRNLTDRQFQAICQTGGVVGLNLFTGFLGEEPVTLEAACNHILHWLELGGEKNVALGGDLDGCDSLPLDFAGVEDYPALARALEVRGVPASVLKDLFWNNAMRVLQSCCT